MKTIRTMRPIPLAALVACALLSPLAWAQTAATPAASASTPARPPIREELRVPFTEIQTLINDKKYEQAKEKLKIVAAIPNKSPYESYLSARFTEPVTRALDDASGTAAAVEQMLQLNEAGGWLKQEDALRLMQGVGITYYRAKDYAQTAVWMERNIKAGGKDPAVKDLRIKSYLLSKNLERGSELLNEEFAASEAAKTAPQQAYIDLYMRARSQLKDSAGVNRALEMMAQYYPSKDSWRSAINALLSRPDLQPRLQIDVFRLAFHLGTLEEANDYTDYISLAQKTVFSGEALRAYDQGAAAGLLGTGASTDAHKKLRAKLAHEVEQDQKTSAADIANVLKKPDGSFAFNHGLNMVGMQQFDKGIDLMEKGIAKGIPKFPEEARLRLGVAYVQAGQTEKAQQIFATLSGPGGITELARYWTWVIRKP